MAKEPSQRFGSCTQFAEHLGQQLSPSFAYAGEIPFRADTQDTQPSLGAAGAPGGAAAERRRRGVLAGALAGSGVAIAGGVVAGVKLPDHPKPTALRRRTPERAAQPRGRRPTPVRSPACTHVDFGKLTGVDGKQAPGATPTTET